MPATFSGALREQNQALEEKLESLKEELSTKTNWYEPKIEQVSPMPSVVLLWFH